MDYTPYFRQIQTALTHCNEFVKKFNKITHYLGNEIYIKECNFKLNNIFLANGFTSEDSDELRKINLFLLLNTDANFKYDLSDDYKICHLLNNFPQLSKCLFLNLMWQLKLDKYYYEAVALTPYWFIAEFLEETVDSLRFSKSFDVIHQVKDLVGAFYTNICRMDYRTSKPGLNDQKLVLEKYIEWISSCLRHYNTPVTEETVTKSKIKTKQYTGHSLNCQISLVLNCLKLFQNKPTFEFDKKFNIYKIYLEKEPEVNNFSVNKYSSAVYEALTQINVILLNTLQNSLLNVTCDDFMFWVEVDIEDNTIEDEDLKRDNLQKLIGEQAYELINIMKGNPDLEHNVIVQLSSISLKPQTLAEVAKESLIGTVLEKIETSKSRRVWLEELLNRRETVYFNTECLQTIIDNIEIVGYGHLTKILRDHQEFDSEQDDEILLNEIFLKGGQRLEIGDLKAFVDELINALGIDYCISSETEIVQEHEITNYLNKITEENLEMGNMWKLILQNPQKFYEKLLENVDSQDESQISTILTLISITCPISNCFIKKQISKEIDEAVKNEKSPRHLLLAGIFKLNIFERKEFVKDLLMMNFSQALSGYTNMNNLLTSLKTLKALTNHLKVSDLLPPLLIQLAQILDKYRWDLLTYSSSREEVVEITISIIQDLTKIVVINGTKNEKDWIKSKIDSLKMMTKFYYQKLSLEKGEAIIPLDKYLHPTEFSNIPKVKITSFLCENIVRCTSKEVRKLMNNENLLNFYTESLSVLSTIVRKSNQKNADECLRKYVTDYVKILSDLLIPTARTKHQENVLLTDVVNLIKKIPPVLYDDLTILFLDSIQELKNCEKYSTFVSKIDECELKRILLD